MKNPLTSKAILILGALILVVASLIYGLSPTGYAVLDDAGAAAEKEIYNVGDMAHIIITPQDADYSIEVFDPDGKLAAISTDFPVEKTGYYMIDAVISSGGKKREVSSRFKVIDTEAVKQIISDINEKETNDTNAAAEEPVQASPLREPEVQTAPKIDDAIKDEQNNVVGKKTEDEKDYETFFRFVGRSGDSFVISFYHNSTSAQKVWVEKEGDFNYALSSETAQPGETVNLTIPLADPGVPKFKLHIGQESEVFEFSITIINVKSHPAVGGYWTVEFNTTGTADLAITPIDGTAFGEDLEFIELRCGDSVVSADYDGTRISYPQYSCAETSYEISKVLTGGPHHLLFGFGTDSAAAHNYATDYVCLVGCTYSTLSDCLSAINDTDAGCVINESNFALSLDPDMSYHIPVTDPAQAAIIINATNVAIDCSNSSISGGQVGYGMMILDFSDITISNCKISNFTTGINVSNSSETNLIGNMVYNNTDTGIYAYNLSLGSIRNNSIYNSSLYSLLVASGNNNSISDNMIYYSDTSYGLFVSSSPNNRIVNNTAMNMSQGGIYISYSDSNKLIGNRINYSNTMALYVENSDDINISNNSIYNNMGVGVYLNLCNNSIIERNELGYNNNGFYLNTVNNVTVIKNTITDQLDNRIEYSNYTSIINNTINNSQNNGIVVYLSNYTNITQNYIENTADGYFDLLINGIDTSVWVNDFLGRGTNDTDGIDSAFCVDGEGNFYADTIPVVNIGNGTGESEAVFGGDCGFVNFTYPLGGETFSAGKNTLTLKKQSSPRRVNYSLYYSNDSGANWHLIGSTASLSYDWITSGYPEDIPYDVRVIPSVSAYNATGYNVSAITISMNEDVCADLSICEYPNITAALYNENNTGNTIYLTDPYEIYALSGTGSYNLYPPEDSPAIYLQNSNVTLDCNYGKIIGNTTGFGVLISGYDYDIIRKCHIYNYSQGIVISTANYPEIHYNLLNYNLLTDLNITTVVSNTYVSHNTFYSRGVNNSGSWTSFCVYDYSFGIPTDTQGNFYNESIDRDYIENVLNDCGPTNITVPQEHANYTTSLNLQWTRQSSSDQNLNYSIRYSDDSGTSWYHIATTSSLNYLWDISGLGSADNYLVKIIPYDSVSNATDAISYYFGIDNERPSLTILNQTNASGSILNSSMQLSSGKNIVINLNASDAYGISSVWVDFWSGQVNSTAVWTGNLNLTDGTVYDGIWGINLTLNESFLEYGDVNYTVYVNDTTSNRVFNNSNFSMNDNEYLCPDPVICEYVSLADALPGENGTANTIMIIGSGTDYIGGGGASYHISPPASRGAIELNATNVSIDCQDSLISGSNVGYGIYSSGFDDITIENCNLARYSSGVNFTTGARMNISNLDSFNNLKFGVWINNGENEYLGGFNLSNNTRASLFFIRSNNSIVNRGIISYSGTGINMTNSTDIQVIGVNSTLSTYNEVYMNSQSSRITLTNSSFSGSSSNLVYVDGTSNNISENTFRNAAAGYYAIEFDTDAQSNNVWLNNIYSGGILNNGTSTAFCVNVKSNLQNEVYVITQVSKSVGNYYDPSVNSSLAPKGSCGNLTEPFDDSDSDTYYSILEDCNDATFYVYPGATEYCDDFDNNCNGQVDETGCVAQPFPSAGSGGGGGSYSLSYEGLKREQDIKENPIVTLHKAESISFIVKGIEHTIKLNKIYIDSVNITVSSNEQSMILKIDDQRILDLDQDKLGDVSIKLLSINSINGTSATFEVKDLEQEAKPPVSLTEEEKKAEEERIKAEEEKKPVEQKPSMIIEAGKGVLGIFKSILVFIEDTLVIIIITALLISLAAGAYSYSRFIGNVRKAEDYVEKALENQVPEAKIRGDLIDAGWEPQIVDSILDAETKNMMQNDVRKKIDEALKEGMSIEEIKKSLKDKGWSEADIENALK